MKSLQKWNGPLGEYSLPLRVFKNIDDCLLGLRERKRNTGQAEESEIK